MLPRRLVVFGALSLALLVAACDEDPPTAPSPQPASITAGAIVPSNGGSVTATGQLPGAFVVRGSGAVSVPLTLTAGRDVPFAELIIFLETSSGVPCGSNLPDRPSWTSFRATDRMPATITGFQVTQLPCQVANIHAYLHTRNNPGLNTPPSAAEIVIEATIPASFTIR